MTVALAESAQQRDNLMVDQRDLRLRMMAQDRGFFSGALKPQLNFGIDLEPEHEPLQGGRYISYLGLEKPHVVVPNRWSMGP